MQSKLGNTEGKMEVKVTKKNPTAVKISPKAETLISPNFGNSLLIKNPWEKISTNPIIKSINPICAGFQLKYVFKKDRVNSI
jgi:hypothetical protein